MENDWIFSFVEEIIIGIGFVEGFWIGLGMNPQTTAFNAMFSAIEQINPGNAVIGSAWTSLATANFVILVGAFFISYIVGGLLGLFAMTSAFIAGIAVFHSPMLGMIFLILAGFLGLFGPQVKQETGGTRAPVYVSLN